MFVDDFSGLTEVCTMLDKQSMAALDEFETFIAQHCGGSAPEAVMADWGTEFDGHFAKYCRDKHIQMHKSCPCRASLNSLVEQADWSLAQVACAMLVDACMGPEFWGAAIKHAAWVPSSLRIAHRNDMGKVSNATPYELCYGAGKPDMKDVKVFGCAGLAHIEQQGLGTDLQQNDHLN